MANTNSFLSSDYSLALVGWQQKQCNECIEDLDVRGVSVVEICGGERRFYHFYCYRTITAIKIDASWIHHIDRCIQPTKITDFVRRQNYLVEQQCAFNLSQYRPQRALSTTANIPLIASFSFLSLSDVCLSVPLVCSQWYGQSLRDEIWLSFIESAWSTQVHCERVSSEPLKVLFLRLFKQCCKECRAPLVAPALKCPFSKQFLCESCAANPDYAIVSYKKVRKHYYISYTGMRSAGVKMAINVHNTPFAFAGQAHRAVLSYRARRKYELEAYLSTSSLPPARLAQLRSLDIASPFPRFSNHFERKMQGFIYGWNKQAEEPLQDFLRGIRFQ